MKIKIVNNLNKKQFSQAIKLLVKYFPAKTKRDGIDHFKFYFNNALKKKIVIALDEKSNLLGIFTLLNRKTSFFGRSLKIIHMSYWVVKNQKDFLTTKKIIDAAINYVNKNSDISVQVQRKIMDHYWTRYGFVGFTNFNDFFVDENNFYEVSNLKIEKLSQQNLVHARNLYNKYNKDQAFSFIRDKAMWKTYLKYIKKKKIDASIIKSKNKVVGYTIIHNEILKEAAIEKGYEKSVLSLIFNSRKKNKSVKNLLIQLSSNNPIIKNLRNYSHTEKLRYVYEGGHTIRIHNTKKFLNKIRVVIQNRLKKVLNNKFELSINEFKFVWKNKKLKIILNKKKSDFFLDNKNFTKLLIGVLDPEELFGINNKNIQFLKIMFPKTFPHLIYMDQLI